MLRCDIIIPVYNAFDCLEECIESVLKRTDFNEAHLILIDDKSPDERVLPLLEEYGKEFADKITVLKNEKNLGFVKTVNKGMRYSKNDVLLLNSDTVVTRNWLKKIRRCAYIDDYVATVTPLSNNATLASVPKMFEDNKIPNGYTLDEMSKLVEGCSMQLYPEIPTAHGFCMYIKRQALDKVGYFDEENFGKGYGEENDFSFRCFKYGYRHLLCDDTYVLHKESRSFLDSKKTHDKEIEKLHPLKKRKLDIWNQTGAIGKIGKNIELALGGGGERKNILVVIHDFDIQNLGGTTMHVMDLIESMRDKYNFHVLYPDDNNYIVRSFYEKSDVVTSAHEKPFVIEDIQFYSSDYKKMVEKIIKEYGISYVHIHHLMGHCFSIIDACEGRNVKYAVTLHDYYLVEAEVGVIEKEVGSRDNEMIDLKEWRKNSERLLKNASEVFAPSYYVKDVFKKFYKLKNISVVEHGVNIEKNRKTWGMDGKWNIAFVGVMCPHKGIGILDYLAKNVPSDLRIHLFGRLPEGKKYGRRFVDHGQYERGDLPKLFKKNKIDLVCILSLWPETYSYTATEAIASGIPVVSFDLGAIKERIEKDNLGFTIPYTRDGGMVLKEIRKILADRKKYDEVVRSIDGYEVKTISEMGDKYKKIYNKYTVAKKVDPELMRSEMVLADYLLSGNGPGKKYKHEYFQLLNSKRWKMVSKIRVPSSAKRIIKLLKGSK